jgi:hypothetical protein
VTAPVQLEGVPKALKETLSGAAPAAGLAFAVQDSVQGAVTVTVAVVLSFCPQPFFTRTQYFVVAVSAGVVKVLDVAPDTGFDVLPLSPWYHWY